MRASCVVRGTWCVVVLVVGACPGRKGEVEPRPIEPLTLDGAWEGAIDYRGATRMLAAEFHHDSTGTVDIPDEYALGYPLQRVRRDSSQVHFELPDSLLPPGRFDGTLERGGARITGTFDGIDGTDTLHATFELWRRVPLDPAHKEEEVHFRNGAVALAGTLFTPDGGVGRGAWGGPYPAIVLLPGRGHRFFADRFARAEFVTLMCGSCRTADDVLSAVEFLRPRPDVTANRVGVWGRSQQARLGALAATLSPHIAFAIMISPDTTTDPDSTLARVRVPMLVMVGADALAPAGARLEVRVVPRADGELRVRGSGLGARDWDWTRPAPGWIDAMIEWAKCVGALGVGRRAC